MRDPAPEEAITHTQECEDAAFAHHAATGGDLDCNCGAVPVESREATCPDCEGTGMARTGGYSYEGDAYYSDPPCEPCGGSGRRPNTKETK